MQQFSFESSGKKGLRLERNLARSLDLVVNLSSIIPRRALEDAPIWEEYPVSHSLHQRAVSIFLSMMGMDPYLHCFPKNLSIYSTQLNLKPNHP